MKNILWSLKKTKTKPEWQETIGYCFSRDASTKALWQCWSFSYSSVNVFCWWPIFNSEFENFQIFSRYLSLVGQGACKHFCTLWILFPSLLKESFMKEDFFILMAFNISNFPFMGHIFVIISNNSSSNHKSPRLFFLNVLYVYILRTCPLSIWDTSCANHEVGVDICCLSVDVHLLQLHLLKTPLHALNCFYIFVENQVGILCGSLSGPSNLFHRFVSIPLPKPHFLNMENSKVNILNM